MIHSDFVSSMTRFGMGLIDDGDKIAPDSKKCQDILYTCKYYFRAPIALSIRQRIEAGVGPPGLPGQ